MLLLPTQVTKMCMWSLHQDDEFYDEEKNQTSWGGGIWNILCKELDVRAVHSPARWLLARSHAYVGPSLQITPQQKRSLMGLRAGIKAQRNRLRASLRMLNDLETHVRAVVFMSTHTRACSPLLWSGEGRRRLTGVRDAAAHEVRDTDAAGPILGVDREQPGVHAHAEQPVESRVVGADARDCTTHRRCPRLLRRRCSSRCAWQWHRSSCPRRIARGACGRTSGWCDSRWYCCTGRRWHAERSGRSSSSSSSGGSSGGSRWAAHYASCGCASLGLWGRNTWRAALRSHGQPRWHAHDALDGPSVRHGWCYEPGNVGHGLPWKPRASDAAPGRCTGAGACRSAGPGSTRPCPHPTLAACSSRRQHCGWQRRWGWTGWWRRKQ